MKVYLTAGLFVVLMGAHGTRGDSRLTLKDGIMDSSLDNSKPMFLDFFKDASQADMWRLWKCPEHALGMESGAIPDGHITASTTDGRFSPSFGRLNIRRGNKAWAAKHNRAGEWLQVDLGKVTKVKGVATQGRDDHNQWVKSYTLKFSLDGKRFLDYEGGKVFQGNRDRRTVVKHELEPAIIGRYIRLVVKSWHSHICLRMELYGCK